MVLGNGWYSLGRQNDPTQGLTLSLTLTLTLTLYSRKVSWTGTHLIQARPYHRPQSVAMIMLHLTDAL